MACAAPFTLDEARRKERAFEALEAKITELWGHLNAATYRFLLLVAEFDHAKAYERHGLANTAQWLNWQCGIGPVAAREKVRVARALEQLPRDQRRVREGRDLLFQGAWNDARRDGGERVGARERRAPRHGGARREARAEVSLDAAARCGEERAATARVSHRLVLFRRGRHVHLARAIAGRGRRGGPQGAAARRRSGATAERCFRGNCLANSGERAQRRCATARRGDVSRASRGGDGRRRLGRPRSSRRAHRPSDSVGNARRPRPRDRTAASSTTVRRSRSTRRGGSPATPRSSVSSKAKTASRSTSAASRAAFRRRSPERSKRATAAADTQAAIARASPKVITSSTGPTAAKRNSAISSRSAAFITGSCTKAATGSGRPTTGSSFSRGPTGGAWNRTARIVSAETFRRFTR